MHAAVAAASRPGRRSPSAVRAPLHLPPLPATQAWLPPMSASGPSCCGAPSLGAARPRGRAWRAWSSASPPSRAPSRCAWTACPWRCSKCGCPWCAAVMGLQWARLPAGSCGGAGAAPVALLVDSSSRPGTARPRLSHTPCPPRTPAAAAVSRGARRRGGGAPRRRQGGPPVGCGAAAVGLAAPAPGARRPAVRCARGSRRPCLPAAGVCAPAAQPWPRPNRLARPAAPHPPVHADGLLGRLQAKAVQRLLAVAVQYVRVEVADVCLRYVQVRRAVAAAAAAAGSGAVAAGAAVLLLPMLLPPMLLLPVAAAATLLAKRCSSHRAYRSMGSPGRGRPAATCRAPTAPACVCASWRCCRRARPRPAPQREQQQRRQQSPRAPPHPASWAACGMLGHQQRRQRQMAPRQQQRQWQRRRQPRQQPRRRQRASCRGRSRCCRCRRCCGPAWSQTAHRPRAWRCLASAWPC